MSEPADEAPFIAPCPCCESPAELRGYDCECDRIGCQDRTYIVCCLECSLTTGQFDTEEEALVEWNRRPEDVCYRDIEEGEMTCRTSCGHISTDDLLNISHLCPFCRKPGIARISKEIQADIRGYI